MVLNLKGPFFFRNSNFLHTYRKGDELVYYCSSLETQDKKCMKGISNRNIYKELKKTVAREGYHYQRENHRTTILLLLAFLHPLKKT